MTTSTPADESRPFQVFVTVGTDHHAFDRLVEWVDAWAAGRDDVEVLVQHGTSAAPEHGHGTPYLTYDAMVDAFSGSDVVVCHGGPATIMDARHAGRLPLVLPRSGDRGEHVDNHQVRFTSRLAELEQIVLIQRIGDLHTALDLAVTDRGRFQLPADRSDTLDAVVAFADVVAELRPGTRSGPRLRDRLLRRGAA